MTENKPDQDRQPSAGFAIGAQYIKDVSFENKLSPDILQASSKEPRTDIQFHVSTKKLGQDQNEVCLRVVAQLHINDQLVYLLDLTYAGLFMLRGLDASTEEKVLNIECPRLLYPSARTLVLVLSQDSGLPPLYLSPAIDFAQLFQQQQKKRTAH